MQAYSRAFARVYNELWADFAQQVAPPLLQFYAQTPAGAERRPVLDLCCGTGQLARHFLEHGYAVTGLDLSSWMLAHAVENNAEHVANGQARFATADAASFTLDECFGLVVSTYDALNHLDGLKALRGCFRSVHAVLEPGGCFIFDLNTRVGLGRWAGMNVQETETITLIQRGKVDDEAGKAWMQITGFVQLPNGLYERFEERIFNTSFQMEAVRLALLDQGYAQAYPASLAALTTPLAAPEEAGRVFFVARKAASSQTEPGETAGGA